MPKRRNLTKRQQDTIQDYVYSDLNDTEIMEKLSIAVSTYYGWFKNDLFREGLREEFERRDSDPRIYRNVPFVAFLRNMEERMRLYETLPDSAPDKTIEVAVPVDSDGNPTQDSAKIKEYHYRQMVIRKSNAAIKNTILNDILDAMERRKGKVYNEKEAEDQNADTAASPERQALTVIERTLAFITAFSSEGGPGKPPGTNGDIKR